MAAGNTYVALATNTLTGSAASVTFSSISGAYTDLVLVITGVTSASGTNDTAALTFNSDTSTGSTNYSVTNLIGDGTSATSGRASSSRNIDTYSLGAASNTTPGTIVTNIMNYSNTTTYKTIISKGGNGSAKTGSAVGLWRNTAAITSITLWPSYNGSGNNFSTGCTFQLFGIAAA